MVKRKLSLVLAIVMVLGIVLSFAGCALLSAPKDIVERGFYSNGHYCKIVDGRTAEIDGEKFTMTNMNKEKTREYDSRIGESYKFTADAGIYEIIIFVDSHEIDLYKSQIIKK